jgi:predicted ATPase
MSLRSSTSKVILMVAALLVAAVLSGCDSEARQAARAQREAANRVQKAIDESLAQRQSEIDTAMSEAQQSLDEAFAIAGAMPEQQEKLDLVQQDLDEIQRLLNDTVEQRAEVTRVGLLQVIDAYGKAIEDLNEAASEAEGADRMRIEQFRDYLSGQMEQLVEAVESAGPAAETE